MACKIQKNLVIFGLKTWIMRRIFGGTKMMKEFKLICKTTLICMGVTFFVIVPILGLFLE